MRLTALIFFLYSVSAFPATEWRQFRGPNSSGVSDAKGLPLEFGVDKNLLWKTALPQGHSSPVLSPDRIFLTGHENEDLFVFGLDRKTGKQLWRKQVPRPRRGELHKANGPASSSPVTDGENVYFFFTDFGLISFTKDGVERWRMELGPFNSPMGLSSSPVLSGNKLLMNCDSESGSFFVGVNKDTGKLIWRRDRSEFTRGFSTPVLYQQANQPMEAIVAGSTRLVSYSVDTGEPIWWIDGLTWQLKPTPVMDKENIYVLGWAGDADQGNQEEIADFKEYLAKWDKDGDGKLSKEEIPDKKIVNQWESFDLDRTGFLEERDWKAYQSRKKVVNAVRAFKLGGKGDMTAANTLWSYYKSLPNVPSPLLYEGILYICKESGILTALDAKTGKVLKQARLNDAPGDYFSSPVAAGGRIFTISHEGKVSVIKPGAAWEVERTIVLNEDVNATPAFEDGKIYIRTHQHLYCFGKRD